jgi:glycosyltransferase involved in cell wall biosynthesis
MKILVISNMYPGHDPCFGIFVHRQICDLEKQGEVEVNKIARTKNSSFSYLSFLVRILVNLLIKRSSYDVIHAHYGFHSALIPALIKRAPLVLTFHGSDALLEPFRNKVYYYLQRFVISRADRIIAVSHDIKRSIIRRLGCDSEKIDVISCGVDTTVFRPMDKFKAREILKIDYESKLVLFVGKLTYLKGVDIIYECAGALPDVDFYLAGEGPMRCDLPNCHFLGSVPNHQLPTWLGAADLFVLPSRTEGTPVVILEAFACGLPVVASDVGGIPDLLSNHKTGYLLPMKNELGLRGNADQIRSISETDNEIRNSDIMIEVVSSLLNQQGLLSEMGRNARLVAESVFESSLITLKILKTYSEITNFSGMRNKKMDYLPSTTALNK